MSAPTKTYFCNFTTCIGHVAPLVYPAPRLTLPLKLHPFAHALVTDKFMDDDGLNTMEPGGWEVMP